ncbi:uncharacterized protein LOC123967684 [Micropterus dolomieu]|uniref:uncharacterized protein LOC123967684 n=1 Tax=Micropterus dolomieu TaxID=147949 RepID=UPI001E8E0C67|nr:uncharacterized protein LOC123967684 [Micropterus dolomieu]
MFVASVVFLSVIVLQSVSAGGVYCAKTARARAAALGLDFPGVHGAPDLYGRQTVYGPAHHGMYPSTVPFRPQLYYNSDRVKTELNTAPYRQSLLGVRSLDGRIHKQLHPRSSESSFRLSHGTYNPVQSEYTTDQALSFPRGQSVINHQSNFEVKHVAPPTLSEAPGQPDSMNWYPQGRNKLHSFAYNDHDLVVDESVPNGRGMSLSRFYLPQSQVHSTYQRGLAGYGLGRAVPVLDLYLFTNNGHARAMTSQGAAVGKLTSNRFPARLAQRLHRNPKVKQFVQGNPAFRRLPEPKSGPVRISLN